MLRIKSQAGFNFLTCALLTAAIMLPTVAWLQNNNWNLEYVTAYRLFPLLGLWAWLIMWTHFVVGAVRLRSTELTKNELYSTVSRTWVLAALILHPGILLYKQYDAGFGLPPGSAIAYVGEPLKLAIYFGLVAWLIFISFEFFDRFKTWPRVRRNWRWVSLSQALAMSLVFIHALRLGSVLTSGWFLAVWWIAGLVLLPCFYIILKHDFTSKNA